MFTKLKKFFFRNTTTSQTIAKNTFWLTAGQFIGRCSRAIIVIYAARVLGAESWGAFSYAIGVAALLTIFSDIGINALITKETTRRSELKHEYIATAFFLKLVLLSIVLAIVLIAFPYFSRISEATAIMPIVILVFAFDTMRDLGTAIARSIEQMEIEGLVNIFTNVAITVLGIYLLSTYRTATSLAYAYTIGSGLGLVAMWIPLRSYFTELQKNFRRNLVRTIIETAWPFGLLGIMGAIMLNTDLVMIGSLRPLAEVGYYSAAQKMILLAYVLPGLFASSIFPILARSAKDKSIKARTILEESVAIAILVAIPICAFGLLFGGSLLTMLYGIAYAPSIATLNILMLTTLIIYPSTLLGNALFAYDEQRYFLKFVALVTLSNAVLDYILIVPYGIEGSAVATVITQLIANTLLWRKVQQCTGCSLKRGMRNVVETIRSRF